jgi:hypothetical protein
MSSSVSPRRAGSRVALIVLVAVAGASNGPARAGTADVVAAKVRCQGERCRFAVSVRHADSGWNHYADRYEVLDAEGEVLATRVLRHPHVDEQPFTRTLDAQIPLAVKEVRIRAHDSEHGHGGEEQTISLER